MAYAVPVAEIRAAAAQGYFFMKVKIGQPGTQQQMLEKDKARLTEIHEALAAVETPHTRDGKLPYYFDANGRYESKDTLLRQTNGHQNYRNWEAMRRNHPCYGAPWTVPTDGVFRLDDDFYARSGGILFPSPHYEELFRHS